jgi:phage terminase large subunit GpA-like protein
VGTEQAKDKAAAALRIDEPGPGFCHFPITYSDDYFKQLTSEHRVRAVRLGFSVWRWVKKKAGARNEAWDCRVYNIFAKELLRPNYEKLRARLLAQVGQPGPAPLEQPELEKPEAPRPARPLRLPRRRGGFVKNW